MDGAGDQGIMFGYASNETEEYMPYAISVAHKLAKKLTECTKTKRDTIFTPRWKNTGNSRI